MNATCGRCGSIQQVDLAVSDFRCEVCAVAEVDEAARRRRGLAFKLIAAGLVLFGFTVLMWRANWNPGESPSTDGMDGEDFGLIFYIGFAAVGLVGGGLGMLKLRPRLRR